MVAASTGVTGWLVGRSATAVAGDKMAPWILGRASGICAYLLLVALVALGLVLSHPWRGRWNRPSAVVRIRAHVSLSAFTLAFLVLHIVVLATDEYAKVGWWGALLPMASEYRPVPVTLGVIATYGGLIAGLTAAMAGRWAARVWWPVHKVAALSLVAALLHGILAGVDTKAIAWLYAVTTVGLIILAATRYLAGTPDDKVEAFIAGTERSGPLKVPSVNHLHSLPPTAAMRLVPGQHLPVHHRPGLLDSEFCYSAHDRSLIAGPDGDDLDAHLDRFGIRPVTTGRGGEMLLRSIDRACSPGVAGRTSRWP